MYLSVIMKSLNSIILLVAFIGCASDSRLFDYGDFKKKDRSAYRQDEFTSQLLPNIASIDSLICLVATNSMQPEVYSSRQLFSRCDSGFFSRLNACTASKGNKLILKKHVEFPRIVLSVSIENDRMLLNIGIMNSANAGNGFIYYLVPQQGNNYLIGKVKKIWVY